MSGLLNDRLGDRLERPEKNKSSKKKTENENKPNHKPDNKESIISQKHKISKPKLENKEMPDENQDFHDDIITKQDAAYLEELEDIMSDRELKKEEKKRKKITKIIQILLTIGCVYLVILIYGVVITEFSYDDAGKISPVTMSISDIKEQNEYNQILALYIQARSTYEEILTLDYRMSAGQEDTLLIAPDYEEERSKIINLANQIEAASFSSKYNQVASTLLTCVGTHMAEYCSYMSDAITNNSEADAQEAIACREVLNGTFQQVTENMIVIGSVVKGIDLTDIKDWSPDNFIASTIEGIGEE